MSARGWQGKLFRAVEAKKRAGAGRSEAAKPAKPARLKLAPEKSLERAEMRSGVANLNRALGANGGAFHVANEQKLMSRLTEEEKNKLNAALAGGSSPAPPTSSAPGTVSTPPPSGGSGAGTVAHWGQCGGQGWTGGTVCDSPFTCTCSNACTLFSSGIVRKVMLMFPTDYCQCL